MRPRIANRPTRRYRRRTVRVSVEFAAPDGIRTETATTLGAGGLFIESEEPLPEGSQLKLRFALSDEGQVFEIEGRVVWCHRPSDRDGHGSGMGIEFTDRENVIALALELERP